MKTIEQKIDYLVKAVEQLNNKIDSIITHAIPIAPKAESGKANFSASTKVITLPELARQSALDNGQQRLTAIIGYYEKVQGKDNIVISDIMQGWRDGKFAGRYAPIYLHRAIKDGLVRQKEKGLYDLSQTGEDFFNKIFVVNK